MSHVVFTVSVGWVPDKDTVVGLRHYLKASGGFLEALFLIVCEA